MKIKKYQSGGPAPLKKVAKKAVKDSVESEMHPGKKIPVSKSNYETGKIGKMAAAGKPKAKDGKWIQKAINPKHKGYCTPMTKKTCTPKRKALAMTLKKMAKSRKGK